MSRATGSVAQFRSAASGFHGEKPDEPPYLNVVDRLFVSAPAGVTFNTGDLLSWPKVSAGTYRASGRFDLDDIGTWNGAFTEFTFQYAGTFNVYCTIDTNVDSVNWRISTTGGAAEDFNPVLGPGLVCITAAVGDVLTVSALSDGNLVDGSRGYTELIIEQDL